MKRVSTLGVWWGFGLAVGMIRSGESGLGMLGEVDGRSGC